MTLGSWRVAARCWSAAEFEHACYGGSKVGVANLVRDVIFGLENLRLFIEEV